MATEEKPLRADAERNRRRLLEAAETLFSERGLDVGVGEIAARAGVGRGTLFRNFPSKEHLIAAIVVDAMGEVTTRGQELAQQGDPGTSLFEFLDDIVGRQQRYRSLFDAISDAMQTNPDMLAAQAEFLRVLDLLLARAQDAGAVRTDVGAMDVLMLLKGVCEATSALGVTEPDIVGRQLDLVRAAISVSAAGRPLRGRPRTLADVEREFRQAGAPGIAAG